MVFVCRRDSNCSRAQRPTTHRKDAHTATPTRTHKTSDHNTYCEADVVQAVEQGEPVGFQDVLVGGVVEYSELLFERRHRLGRIKALVVEAIV